MIFGEDVAGVYLYNWPGLIIPAISWIAWGIVFSRSFSSEKTGSFISTVINWLLRGSILELLVAIPSHIISRQRDDCCAPPFLLLGIATGLSIALMSFGPGVIILFAQRIKTKNRNQNSKAIFSRSYVVLAFTGLLAVACLLCWDFQSLKEEHRQQLAAELKKSSDEVKKGPDKVLPGE